MKVATGVELRRIEGRHGPGAMPLPRLRPAAANDNQPPLASLVRRWATLVGVVGAALFGIALTR